MAFIVPDLKKVKQALIDVCGVPESVSARVVGYGVNNCPDIISAAIAGDVSRLPDLVTASGLCGTKKDHVTKKDHGPTNNTIKEYKTALKKPVKASKTDHVINNHLDNITASAGLSDIVPADGDIINDLPPGFGDTVAGWLQDYAIQYNVDLEKCAALQWRALCISIGEKIQASGILRDHAREKTHGGKIYNPHAVAALVPIWEKLTALYKHVPLAVDFCAFSGVSHEWFYDSRGVLTSGRVEISKKVRAIEEAALAAALCDSRENPTGRIYYTKARLGWHETTEIIHTSAAAAVGLSDVPRLAEKTQ